MDLHDFIRVIRTRWPSVVVMTVAGIGAGIASVLLATTLFTSSTRLFVSVQSNTGSATEVGQGSNAAQQKTRSYADIVTTSRVLGPVIDELGLHETAHELAQRITTTAPQNTVTITINVTDTDPERAATIANAVGASFAEVVTGSLEKPVGGGQSLVRIETVEPATASGAPSSPRAAVNLALGGFAGLVAGFALALFRNAVDTRVRGKRDIEAVTDHPVLGEIGFDSTATLHPLIVQGDPRNPRAEAFRALRTSLLFVDLASEHKSLVVTSAMPSEGKTTSTANLAITLAENGAKVALIDADLRRPRLADVMGLEGTVGVTDLLIGQAEIGDVAQPWGRGALTVIPAGQTPPNPSELLGSGAMRALLDELEGSYDHVLIDSPPLLPVTDAAVLSKLTGGTIVISAAGRSRRPQLERALADLEAIGARVLGIVLTMAQRQASGSYGGYGYGGYGADTTGGRTSRRARREARAAARARRSARSAQ